MPRAGGSGAMLRHRRSTGQRSHGTSPTVPRTPWPLFAVCKTCADRESYQRRRVGISTSLCIEHAIEVKPEELYEVSLQLDAAAELMAATRYKQVCLETTQPQTCLS
eukprot:3941407-Rhodomonas_salina.7